MTNKWTIRRKANEKRAMVVDVFQRPKPRRASVAPRLHGIAHVSVRARRYKTRWGIKQCCGSFADNEKMYETPKYYPPTDYHEPYPKESALQRQNKPLAEGCLHPCGKPAPE